MANKNLMSLTHEALATFVLMKYHSSEPSLVSTLFENGQNKYFDVLATTTPVDLETQLETVSSYFNFLSLLAKSNIGEDPQMLQIYLELAVNPIIEPTLVAIGRMENLYLSIINSELKTRSYVLHPSSPNFQSKL